jgi:energy-coupling factor transporter ATP-binding protein EcfA2
MLGTTVGRSVGTRLRGQQTAPNLFVLLVAGPGSGKSQTVKAIKSVLIPATGISTIPASVTRAGLQDYMVDNLKTRIAPDGSQIPSNECIALSDEMQGILPEHDIGHLTLYNELYEVASVYKARTRYHGELTYSHLTAQSSPEHSQPISPPLFQSKLGEWVLCRGRS